MDLSNEVRKLELEKKNSSVAIKGYRNNLISKLPPIDEINKTVKDSFWVRIKKKFFR